MAASSIAGAAPAVTLESATSRGSDAREGAGQAPVESLYVADLRSVAAEVEAALSEAKTLGGASEQLTWVRQAPALNPAGSASPSGWTVSTGDGRIDVMVTVEPKASFTGTWDSPPPQAAGGTEFVMNVAVSGAITSDPNDPDTVQGFRHLDLIEIKGGRWTNQAVGAGVSCVDPIGAEPLSCTGPSSGEGTFRFGFPTSGETINFGVGALNCGACYVEYTYVAQSKETTQKKVGERLAKAIERAKAMLKTYKHADTRHGTAEEHRLVDQIMSQLARAGRILGNSTDSPVRTTPRQKKLAKKILDQVKVGVAAEAADRWPGLKKVAAVLENPRAAAGRVVRKKVENRLVRFINRGSGRILNKTFRGIPIQLGVPLRPQLRWAAEDYVLKLIGEGVLKIDPTGLLLSFAGEKIRIAIKDMVRAARPTGKVVRRTDLTLKGFAKREEALERFRADVNSSLSDVREAVYNAEGAHEAARHLRRDLKALVKRRCTKRPNSQRCEGAQKTRARLVAADKRLERTIDEMKRVFLLDGAFDPAELRSQIKALCALEGSISRINTKLA